MSIYGGNSGGGGSASGITYPITIDKGGTNAITAGGARTNLGLGSIATSGALDYLPIYGGTLHGSAASISLNNLNASGTVDVLTSANHHIITGTNTPIGNDYYLSLGFNGNRGNVYGVRQGVGAIPIDINYGGGNASGIKFITDNNSNIILDVSAGNGTFKIPNGIADENGDVQFEVTNGSIAISSIQDFIGNTIIDVSAGDGSVTLNGNVYLSEIYATGFGLGGVLGINGLSTITDTNGNTIIDASAGDGSWTSGGGYFELDPTGNINANDVTTNNIYLSSGANGIIYDNGINPIIDTSFNGGTGSWSTLNGDIQFNNGAMVGNVNAGYVASASYQDSSFNTIIDCSAGDGIAHFPFSIAADSSVTTVNGSTSGTAKFSQPIAGDAKKSVMIYANALVGTASYTFPVAFSATPNVVGSTVSGLTVSSLTSTAITLTGTTATGFIELIGF